MYSINTHNLDNEEYTLIEVKQSNIEVTFMDFGATVLSIFVPDKDGKMETVLLGYENLTSYVDGSMFLNAIIGPTSGRIKNGEFDIDNEPYYIDKNFMDTENLHGGFECFAFKFFEYKVIDELGQTQVLFTFHNVDRGSAFPGDQLIQIIYTVKEGSVEVQFKGDTTEPTLLNLTSHMYFNLSGNLKRKILDNELQINASNTIALDDKFVPIKVESLQGTHLDFIESKPIKDNFYEGIYNRPEKGIDNPYILDEVTYNKPCVILKDPQSKRTLEVFTTYPSVVCYTHNYPDELGLLFNRKHEAQLGICFETQNPPNGINIDGLESSILRPLESYYHKTLYKFSVEE